MQLYQIYIHSSHKTPHDIIRDCLSNQTAATPIYNQFFMWPIDKGN